MSDFSNWSDNKLTRAIAEESAVLQALKAELASRNPPASPAPIATPSVTVEQVVQVVNSICRGTAAQVRARISKASIDDVREKLDEAVCLQLITLRDETYYSLKHSPRGT